MEIAEIIAIVLGGGVLGTVGYIVNGMDKKSEKGDDAIISKMEAEFERLDQGRKEDRERLQIDIDRLDNMNEQRRTDVQRLFDKDYDKAQRTTRLEEQVKNLQS